MNHNSQPMPSKQYIQKYSHKIRSREEINKPFETHKHKVPDDLIEKEPDVIFKKNPQLLNQDILELRSKLVWKFIRERK